MVTYFNLDSKHDSDIEYEISRFPDSQKSVIIKNNEEIEKLYQRNGVCITKSLRSFDDLGILSSAVSVVSKHTNNYSIYIPYLIGARSDRKFSIGGDMYLHDVIIPIIESFKAKTCYVLEPHCELPKSFTPIPFKEYFNYEHRLKYTINAGYIFPDASARKYNHLNVNFTPSNSCNMIKTRKDGVITQVPSDEESLKACLQKEQICIFDDLFDGGGSFVELCKKIRNEFGFKGKITIFVAHFIGLNTDNLATLNKLNVGVITSNSYRNDCDYLESYDCYDVYYRDTLNKFIR